MIKRQYFISGGLYLEGKVQDVFYAQFWFKSFLPKPESALSEMVENAAKRYGVKTKDLHITSFGRC